MTPKENALKDMRTDQDTYRVLINKERDIKEFLSSNWLNESETPQDLEIASKRIKYYGK
jgi:hypothetical protein